MEALTTRRNNPEVIALWSQRITECKNSGISAQEWCEQNGINIKTYYYWHNKIHKIVSSVCLKSQKMVRTYSFYCNL